MTEEKTEIAPPAEEGEEELKKPKKACCGCFPEKKPEEEKRKIPFCNIFRFAGKIEILLLTIGILFNAATGCAVPVFILIFGDMLDEFVSTTPDLDFFAALLVIIGAVTFVVSFIATTCMEMSAERQVREYRRQFFKAVVGQEMGYFDTNDPGVLSTKINSSVVLMRDAFGIKFGQVLVDILRY
eukprot:GHVU01231867.1.p3 GENE.GHVU01231867.1~~GHVU01231867.1.p3  ORF type:complete len:184 (+),score=44.27 GHVU01231867.1:77-628(+)